MNAALRSPTTPLGVRYFAPDEAEPPVRTLAEDDAPSLARHDQLRDRLFVVFGVLGAIFVAYLVSLIVLPGFHYSLVLNGWLPDAFEIVVAGICIARGFVREPNRLVALFLGCGLLSWAAGDTIWTIQTYTGAASLTNVVGALTWLGFYPLAYIAIVFYLRREISVLTAPGLLDGAIAALGTAAICSIFAFQGFAQPSGGSAFTEATNLAYPIGDVLLLALVVASTAILSGHKFGSWTMLAAACLLNCVGDTFNLFQSTEGALRLDAIFHALAWPAAGLLMTIAVWLRPRPADLSGRQKPTGLLLPGLAATAALGILITATVRPIAEISVVIAIAALITAGIRLFRSAQKLRLLTEQRHRQSVIDELTGLGNRRILYDVLDTFFLDQSESSAQRRALAFLFLDLNDFKEINDHFGHLAGDELLRQVGPRLKDSLRGSDLLVRFGGDEFALVLMDATAEYASSVAQRLTSRLEAPFVLRGVSATVSASIGIAMVPDDAEDIESLFMSADVAMYRAKLARSPFAFFDPRLDAGSQWQLGDELRSAIEHRQFELHYQPQLDLRTGRVVGVEALVRWRHPRLGMLAPAKFLPLAEHAGLMPSLTALLLEIAIEQEAAWRGDGRAITTSVNISAANLLDEGFAERVQGLLERYQVPSDAIVLEITETSVIANFDESRRVIEKLRDLGLDVSIDDFGAGFTSLSYLSSLAVRELKLDCKLITGIANNERDRELVRSTIELGHVLDLRVVTEGVEDTATLDLVRGLGADRAQGYLIGRPMPSDELFARPSVSIEPRWNPVRDLSIVASIRSQSTSVPLNRL